jgi:hypothetical protein
VLKCSVPRTCGGDPAPNLDDSERRMLMIDAVQRAQESGVTINNNKIMRRVIYGYD